MKRSEINDCLRLARDFFAAFRVNLPPWASWTPENWAHCGPEVQAIKDCALGWDVTDFGLGKYREEGLLGCTLRNWPPEATGNAGSAGGYSQKIALVLVHQSCPLHFLRARSRDLINQGGGDLLVQLYGATPEDSTDRERRVGVLVNGIVYHIKAGGVARLTPGDSMRVPPRVYHKFWAEKASCLLGEVSTACNDATDCHFQDPGVQRHPPIEEDEAPLHLLSFEYPDLD